MNNTEHGDMHMNAYSFMGMHWFWWGFIVLFALLLLVVSNRYRKRK